MELLLLTFWSLIPPVISTWQVTDIGRESKAHTLNIEIGKMLFTPNYENGTMAFKNCLKRGDDEIMRKKVEEEDEICLTLLARRSIMILGQRYFSI